MNSTNNLKEFPNTCALYANKGSNNYKIGYITSKTLFVLFNIKTSNSN